MLSACLIIPRAEAKSDRDNIILNLAATSESESTKLSACHHLQKMEAANAKPFKGQKQVPYKNPRKAKRPSLVIPAGDLRGGANIKHLESVVGDAWY